MNEYTTEAAVRQIKHSVAALNQELTKLTNDLCALRARLNAGEAPVGHVVSRKLADIAQWIVIAQEMEHRFEAQSQKSRTGSSHGASLDLNRARIDIGRKLDRLRAARRSDSVS